MDGFVFSCPVEVRYSDVDAMNHVNNAVYLTYLETARVRLWQTRFGFTGSAREIPIILARVAVDYRSPISLEQPVEIGIGVSAIGRTSFTFRYRIEAAGQPAAEAETVQVCFDYAASRPVPIDGELRRHLEALRV
ncbi:MAG: acyl-CoA thioesterase [Acidobacteriia bacterium]|nr:acyl-CoA thioesterase [Terriglobia bacterium]